LLGDDDKGNVVDLLSSMSYTEREDNLRHFVHASVPYFPTSDPSRIASDFVPVFSNLLGLKKGESRFSTRNAALIFELTSSLSASWFGRTGGDIPAPEPGAESALVLVRQMTGFPLRYYARLDELHQAYHATPTFSGSRNECHIDFNTSWEDLPIIRAIDINEYKNIRDNIEYVLLGMVLGWINWDQGSYSIAVPDRLQAGVVNVTRLGNRIHRAIESVCAQEPMRSFVERSWYDWANRASPRDWAGLYVSGMKTWADTKPVVDVGTERRWFSPLRNCYEGILNLATRRLKATDEGLRWLEALSFRPPDHTDEAASEVEIETIAVRFERTCLRRISPEVPIYQVLTERLTEEMVLPEPNEGSF
jgi:hypothetical protein